MRYWVYKDAEILGPVHREELPELDGFDSSLLVCPEEGGADHELEWVNAADIPELASLLEATTSRQPVVPSPVESELPPVNVQLPAKPSENPATQLRINELQSNMNRWMERLSSYEQQQKQILDQLAQKDRELEEKEKQLRAAQDEARALKEAPPPSPPPPPAPKPLEPADNKFDQILKYLVEKDRSSVEREDTVRSLRQEILQLEVQQKKLLDRVAEQSRIAEEKDAALRRLASFEEQQRAILDRLDEQNRILIEKDRAVRSLKEEIELLRKPPEAPEKPAPVQEIRVIQLPAPPPVTAVADERLELLNRQLALFEQQQKSMLERLDKQNESMGHKDAMLQAVRAELNEVKSGQSKLLEDKEAQLKALHEEIERLKTTPPAATRLQPQPEPAEPPPVIDLVVERPTSSNAPAPAVPESDSLDATLELEAPLPEALQAAGEGDEAPGAQLEALEAVLPEPAEPPTIVLPVQGETKAAFVEESSDIVEELAAEDVGTRAPIIVRQIKFEPVTSEEPLTLRSLPPMETQAELPRPEAAARELPPPPTPPRPADATPILISSGEVRKLDPERPTGRSFSPPTPVAGLEPRAAAFEPPLSPLERPSPVEPQPQQAPEPLATPPTASPAPASGVFHGFLEFEEPQPAQAKPEPGFMQPTPMPSWSVSQPPATEPRSYDPAVGEPPLAPGSAPPLTAIQAPRELDAAKPAAPQTRESGLALPRPTAEKRQVPAFVDSMPEDEEPPQPKKKGPPVATFLLVGSVGLMGLFFYNRMRAPSRPAENTSQKEPEQAKSAPLAEPAQAQNPLASSVAVRPATQQQPAAAPQAAAPPSAFTPLPQPRSRRDFIEDPSAKAIQLVQNYSLGKGRSTVAEWLQYSFLSPGRKEEWTANAGERNLYFVRYRVLTRDQRGPDSEIVYIFEADMGRNTVSGINPRAKSLLANSGKRPARQALKKASKAAPSKKAKNKKNDYLMDLP